MDSCFALIPGTQIGVTPDTPSPLILWENCRAGSLPTVPTCFVWSWRLKECFPLTWVVKGIWKRICPYRGPSAMPWWWARMALIATSENRSSDIVDLQQVLIRFIIEHDHSASALVNGRLQAMTWRRWMFGKKHLRLKYEVLVKVCLQAPYLLTAGMFSI